MRRNAVARSRLSTRRAARGTGRERPRRREPRGAGGRARARGRVHRPIERSSWVAMRQFPAAAHESGQRDRRGKADPRVARERAVGARLHRSALARARAHGSRPDERDDAEKAYEEARAIYRRIAEESPVDAVSSNGSWRVRGIDSSRYHCHVAFAARIEQENRRIGEKHYFS